MLWLCGWGYSRRPVCIRVISSSLQIGGNLQSFCNTPSQDQSSSATLSSRRLSVLPTGRHFSGSPILQPWDYNGTSWGRGSYHVSHPLEHFEDLGWPFNSRICRTLGGHCHSRRGHAMSGDGGVQRTPEKDFSTGIEAQSSHSEGELGANGVQDTATYTEVSITGSEDEAALFEAAQAVAELASTGNVSESCKGLRSIFKSLSTWPRSKPSGSMMEWRDEGVQISRTVWKATDSACTSVMTLLNNRGDYRGTRQIWAQAEKCGKRAGLNMYHCRMFAAIHGGEPFSCLEGLYGTLVKIGLKPDNRTLNYLLGFCAKESNRQAAKAYIASAKSMGVKLDTEAYCHLFRCRFALHEIPEVLAEYRQMHQQGVSPSASIFKALLTSIEESLERAKHETLAAKGHKDVDIASLFVEELGQDAAALHVLPANHYVLSCMFSVLGSLELCESIIEAAEDLMAIKPEEDRVPYKVWSKALFELCSKGTLAQAQKLAELMEQNAYPLRERDYGQLIRRCIREGQLDEGLALVQGAESTIGIHDHRNLLHVVRLHLHRNDFTAAFEAIDRMQGPASRQDQYTALLDASSRAKQLRRTNIKAVIQQKISGSQQPLNKLLSSHLKRSGAGYDPEDDDDFDF